MIYTLDYTVTLRCLSVIIQYIIYDTLFLLLYKQMPKPPLNPSI